MGEPVSDPRTPRSERVRRPSLPNLLGQIPTLVTDLVQKEIELVKTELVGKLKSLGIGAGLLVGALGTVLFMVGVLLTAAVLALSLVMPGWLAALLVALVLLIIAIILGLIGWRVMKRGLPPVPTEAIDSVKSDIRAVRGLAQRSRRPTAARPGTPDGAFVRPVPNPAPKKEP